MTPIAIALFKLVYAVIGIVWMLVIAHVIVSWLVNFQVLNLRQPLVSQIWYLLNRLVDPIYKPVRRFLPPMGGIDLAPLVIILVLYFLRVLFQGYYYQMM